MIRRPFLHLSLALAIATTGLTAVAAEPSLHEVYQAAAAGHLAQARSMMDQVLKEHPNSAKAHFVEAELLARQGQTAQAHLELQRAEVLAPGLPFAQPHAVQELRGLLARAESARPGQAMTTPAASSADASGRTGWVLGLLVVALVLGLILFVLRARRQPTVVPAYGGPMGYGAGAGPVNGPGNGPGNGPVYGPGSGGGLGAGILGGLAAGAAAGAGLVAGEALMHRMLDDPRPGAGSRPGQAFEPLDDRGAPPPADDDMGGSDFGVSDGGAWDDAGGGSSDWN